MKKCLKFIRHLILFPTVMLAIYFAQSQSLDSLYYAENSRPERLDPGIGLSSPSSSPSYAQIIKKSANNIARKYGGNAKVVGEYWQIICEQQHVIGVPAPVIMAIAIHESSFKSVLFLKSGNPFGIKASYPWQGPTFSKMHDGVMTPFRVYASPREAVADFGTVMHSWWYADALVCPFDNYKCFIEGLKPSLEEPGYSSDPTWDKQVLRLIGENALAPLSKQ